jgi:hypothetical protein
MHMETVILYAILYGRKNLVSHEDNSCDWGWQQGAEN